MFWITIKVIRKFMRWPIKGGRKQHLASRTQQSVELFPDSQGVRHMFKNLRAKD
jgi:hypothetical protein